MALARKNSAGVPPDHDLSGHGKRYPITGDARLRSAGTIDRHHRQVDARVLLHLRPARAGGRVLWAGTRTPRPVNDFCDWRSTRCRSCRLHGGTGGSCHAVVRTAAWGVAGDGFQTRTSPRSLRRSWLDFSVCCCPFLKGFQGDCGCFGPGRKTGSQDFGAGWVLVCFRFGYWEAYRSGTSTTNVDAARLEARANTRTELRATCIIRSSCSACMLILNYSVLSLDFRSTICIAVTGWPISMPRLTII